ncbi:RNA polymerase sigma factor [Clostridium vincentii]|uniref:RNA polymerase sigma factor n=1 Tax=Clostridium vincentii TaxID=52704 RepID=A0A2T0BKZ5_9CLOT|nr:sigma-70 family RNA polymerase sigma factor [Clostridium vincentii]PRR84556.1 RNA polymerase sigma factor [Clostridium vincentii]
MNIKYEFVTGEIVEIEVSNNIAELNIEIEKITYNSNQKERRRHYSLDDMQGHGLQFEDTEVDIVTIVEKRERDALLRNELDKLLPQQNQLIKKVFFQGMTIIEIARTEGVSEAAIRNRLNKIYKKLRKTLV